MWSWFFILFLEIIQFETLKTKYIYLVSLPFKIYIRSTKYNDDAENVRRILHARITWLTYTPTSCFLFHKYSSIIGHVLILKQNYISILYSSFHLYILTFFFFESQIIILFLYGKCICVVRLLIYTHLICLIIIKFSQSWKLKLYRI